jgi:hypothetical protein
MTNIPDVVRGFEAVWQQMQKLLADQQTRIEELQRENERLRQERESYWQLCTTILREDVQRNEARWEDDLREAMKTAVPFKQALEEIEDVLSVSMTGTSCS